MALSNDSPVSKSTILSALEKNTTLFQTWAHKTEGRTLITSVVDLPEVRTRLVFGTLLSFPMTKNPTLLVFGTIPSLLENRTD